MASAIVLLHGFMQTGASWRPVIAALGERYRPLAPDIRGHGAAADARPIDFDACVADVAALAPARFALAGYSMGGRIALLAALALGERVERLVLISTTAGIADDVERAARRAADEALAEQLEQEADLDAFARRWAAQPLFAAQPPDVAVAAHVDRLRNAPAGLAAALRGIGTGAMPSLWGRLGALATPVTVLVGDRDEKFRALGERLASATPRAELVVVPGAGHALHLEAPAAVATALDGGE